MIAQIQRQVAAAQQVLAAATAKGSMSQQQVDAALSQLSTLHQNIAAARVDVAETTKTLRAIEEEILDEQADDSEYVLAAKALDKAKDDLNQIVHSYAHLPHQSGKSGDALRFFELAKMSSENRRTMEADSKYRLAKLKMEHAAKVVDGVRQKLFQADAEWVEAAKDLAQAEKDARQNSQQASTVGLGSLGDKQNLRNAQKLAAMAQAIIIQGQARLRSLGATSKSSYSGSSQNKK